MTTVRKTPCRYCPYRRDVPSGVWGAVEYEKLKNYDKPTGEQPRTPFGCHEQTGQLCSGWAQVHNTRGNEFSLLALRMFRVIEGDEPEIPTISVPLFKSGTEAAAHGMKNIKRPGAIARRAMIYLLRLQRAKRQNRKSK